MVRDIIQAMRLGDKTIYVFENHATAIYPWALESAKLQGAKPILLSLDYHTDTHQAFQNYMYYNANLFVGAEGDIRTSLCAAISLRDFPSFMDTTSHLRNDEHIDAALRMGILDRAYIIQHHDRTGTLSIEQEQYFKAFDTVAHIMGLQHPPQPPFSYRLPDNKIFVAPSEYTFDLSECVDGDAALERSFNIAIDDKNLLHRLRCLEVMANTSSSPWISNRKYILDIDLDYFLSTSSVCPGNSGVFRNLIKAASAITIAKETACVEMLRRESDLSPVYLLEKLLEHMRASQVI